MKFRLFGNSQPPNWVLSEVAVLSTIENIDNLCSGACESILYDNNTDGLQTVNTLSSETDQKAVVNLMQYLIKNAAKYNMQPDDAINELGQLGKLRRKIELTHVCIRTNNSTI